MLTYADVCWLYADRETALMAVSKSNEMAAAENLREVKDGEWGYVSCRTAGFAFALFE